MRQDPNDDVRAEAGKAVAAAGRGAIHYVDQVLESALHDSNAWVRLAAKDILVGLGAPATAQLVASLEADDIEVRRGAVGNLGFRIVELLESESPMRKPFVDEKFKAKCQVQADYFQQKHDAKVKVQQDRRKKRRDEARNKGWLTPDDSDAELPPESEDGIEEDVFLEESNQEFNATITTYIEAVAARLTDPDEQIRSLAVGSLKHIRNVVEPNTGRQLLVWQDGRWQARLVKDFVS